MRHTKMIKLICSLLVCSMVFSSGAFIFAQDNSLLVDNMKSATLVRREATPVISGYRHGGFKAVIEKLVEEGKLSREKAEQIDNFIMKKKEEQKKLNQDEKRSFNKGFKYGLVEELVNAKIISDTEAEAIKSKFREIKEQAFNEKLNVLVQKGTITQAQADKVKVYFEAAGRARQEQFKTLKDMTEEQRKAFFKEHKKDNPITKLVNDGVLTKEQAQELRKALKEGHRNKCKEK